MARTPNLNWRDIVPAPGWPIDWGRMPYRLKRCVIFEGEGGGVLNDANGSAGGGRPTERVDGENGITGSIVDVPQSHPFGHRWITWPPANRTGPWGIRPTVETLGPVILSQEKMSFAWASWMQNADGAFRNGPIWNGGTAGAAGFLNCQAAARSVGDCGMSFGGNGGDAGASLGYTDPAVTTGMHHFLYTASTGVEVAAGMRCYQDGVERATRATWTGASKPTLAGRTFSIGGNGPNGNPWCGIIRYVYIFDDFITDVGFAELLADAPYYFFLEPVDPVFSLAPAPLPCPPPFTPILCPPVCPPAPSVAMTAALLARVRRLPPRRHWEVLTGPTPLTTMPLTACPPPFTPVACEIPRPAGLSVARTAQLLAPAQRLRRQRTALRTAVVDAAPLGLFILGTHQLGEPTLAPGDLDPPAIDTIPAGATFMNVPCAPTGPPDPVAALMTVARHRHRATRAPRRSH